MIVPSYPISLACHGAGPGVRANHQGDIMTITETGPYSSMAALRAANALLAEQRRSAGEGPDLVVAAETFVARGSATGALLSEEDARWSAQGLLDYWAAAIERAGGLAPDATLAEINAGSRDGIKEGWVMTIADGANFIGNLRIVQVDVNRAVGIVELEDATTRGEVKSGQRAIARKGE